MKLFKYDPLIDNFQWELELPCIELNNNGDFQEIKKDCLCNITYLGNGFCIGNYQNKDFLMTGKKFEDLTVTDIYEIIENHQISYFTDGSDFITPYELNVLFAKFDKWL